MKKMSWQSNRCSCFARQPRALRWGAAGIAALFLGAAVLAPAQNIVLKDGKTVTAKSLRRDGELLMATMEIAGAEEGQPPKTGEFGYPVRQILRVEFPAPPQLRVAMDSIARGKSAEAVATLDPILKSYDLYRDVPGSWWPEAALRKTQALLTAGREKEAEILAEQIRQAVPDTEFAPAAQALAAISMAHRGEFAKASEIADPILKGSRDDKALAPACVVKGECLLADKAWEDAILTFARVPVFYPLEKGLLPQVLLGRARAHFGLDDFAAARAALNELTTTYPDTAEAKKAPAELQKIARREKALADPKKSDPSKS